MAKWIKFNEWWEEKSCKKIIIWTAMSGEKCMKRRWVWQFYQKQQKHRHRLCVGRREVKLVHILKHSHICTKMISVGFHHFDIHTNCRRFSDSSGFFSSRFIHDASKKLHINSDVCIAKTNKNSSLDIAESVFDFVDLPTTYFESLLHAHKHSHCETLNFIMIFYIII